MKKRMGEFFFSRWKCFDFFVSLFFCIFFFFLKTKKKKTQGNQLSLRTHAAAASAASPAPAAAPPSPPSSAAALRNGFDAMTSAPAVGATAMTAVPRQTTSPSGRDSSVTVRRSSALRWNSIASSRTRLSSWS